MFSTRDALYLLLLHLSVVAVILFKTAWIFFAVLVRRPPSILYAQHSINMNNVKHILLDFSLCDLLIWENQGFKKKEKNFIDGQFLS